MYPREVVKDALMRNSTALLLAKGHPSGLAEPSLVDEALAQSLNSALFLVDVRVLDHLIIGRSDIYSMAEHALM